MRVFIAFNFEELKDYFKELQDQINEEGIRFTFPKSFHLTLKFLGELDEKEVEKIKKLLAEVTFQPYTAVVDAIGVFPNEHYIRVVWVGVEGEETRALHDRIAEKLEGIGKKSRGFEEHITLARVKYIKPERKEGFVEKIKGITTEKKEVTISNFYLIASELSPEGPRYTVLEIYPKQ